MFIMFISSVALQYQIVAWTSEPTHDILSKHRCYSPPQPASQPASPRPKSLQCNWLFCVMSLLTVDVCWWSRIGVFWPYSRHQLAGQFPNQRQHRGHIHNQGVHRNSGHWWRLIDAVKCHLQYTIACSAVIPIAFLQSYKSEGRRNSRANVDHFLVCNSACNKVVLT